MRIIFKVEDFLKIEKAEIDITNFCVFIGNNNSGKTKLMELIYGVLNFLDRVSPSIEYEFVDNKIVYDNAKLVELIDELNANLQKNKDYILRNIFNKKTSIGSMRLDVYDVDKCLEVIKITKENVNTVKLENPDLMNIFPPEILNSDSELLNGQDVYVIKNIKSNDNDADVYPSVIAFSGGTTKQIFNNLNRYIIEQLLNYKKTQSIFFPASRMGLGMLYKEYFNSFGDNIHQAIFGTYKKGVYQEDTNLSTKHITKPVLDYLRFLQLDSFNINVVNENQKLIEFVNDHLLDGKLDVQGGETTYIPNESDTELSEISLYMASSMINEIAPIVKMLSSHRYKMLFYDEVETSLHPLKQLELVKLLNRLNNSGIRLILSTHSNTFVSRLNNLLLLARSGKIGDEPVKLLDGKVEITRDDLLESDDIHIYQFLNKDNGRSEVKELKFRTAPLVGYSFELFEDSANSLFEELKLALGIE